MFHTHSDEMRTFIFVWISVIRLEIHVMQCPSWFNGPTSSGGNIKFTVFLTGAAPAALRAPLFQRICAFMWVFVSGPLLQSRTAVSLQEAPPSLPTNCTCLSLLPPVSHLPACFSLPVCPSLLLCPTSLVSVVFSLAAQSPLLSLPIPACLQRVSGHASYLLTLTGLRWFIHPLPTAMRYVCSEQSTKTHTQNTQPAVNLRFFCLCSHLCNRNKIKNEVRSVRKTPRFSIMKWTE